MKKGNVFIALFLILALPRVLAQTPAVNPEDPFGVGVSADELSNPEQLKQEYLQKNWSGSYANNTVFEPFIRTYGKTAPLFNPLFKYTLGVKTDQGWLFLLTFVIWILFVMYIYRIMSAFSLFSQKWTHYIISIALVVLISNLGVPKKLAEWIINAISFFFTSWWMQLIFWVLAVIVLIILMKFSKQIKLVIQKMKEKKAKKKEEEDRKTLDTTAKAAETIGEGIRKGSNAAENSTDEYGTSISD